MYDHNGLVLSLILSFSMMFGDVFAQSVTLQETIDCSELKNIKPKTQLTLSDELWDAYCSRIFLKTYAPHGLIVVFGSARLQSTHPEYQRIRNFSYQWSMQPEAKIWPVASGGGPGLMEAANRGAKDLNIDTPTLGLTTRFGGNDQGERPNVYTQTEHRFTYRSFSKREGDLIDHAHAVVVGLGGVGTEWELMETLSKLDTGMKKETAVILLGPRQQWASLLRRLELFYKKGTFSSSSCHLMNLTSSPKKAVQLILMNQEDRKADETSLCHFIVNN